MTEAADVSAPDFFAGYVAEPVPPGRDHDFQRMMRARQGVDVLFPDAPTLLVATRTQDVEADVLSLILAREHVNVVRWNVDEALTDVLLLSEGGDRHLWFDGHAIDTVYMRYFDLDLIMAGPGGPTEQFARRQWLACIRSLGHVPGIRTVNGLRGAHDITIPEANAAAANCGFVVPETTITNRANVPHGQSVIVKVLAPRIVEHSGTRYSLFPRRGISTSPSALPYPGPVVVQEFIAAAEEYRVYAIGDQVIAYRVAKKDASDVWLASDEVGVAVLDPDERLRVACLRLMAYLRLDIAAMDILRTDSTLHFLEVNPVCDWRWYERRAGSRAVSMAAAEYLAKTGQDNGRQEARGASHGTGSGTGELRQQHGAGVAHR